MTAQKCLFYLLIGYISCCSSLNATALRVPFNRVDSGELELEILLEYEAETIQKKTPIVDTARANPPVKKIFTIDTVAATSIDTLQDIEEIPEKIPQLQLSKHHDKAFRYIKKYKKLAIDEMNEFDIPASITLAQGLIESGFGLSKMATKHKNHFGVKCKCRRCPKKKCFRYHDDTKYDRFRVYPSAWASYRDHSLFLQRSRYQHLYEFDVTDYENWAIGIQDSGYASDKRYAWKLIKVIELYKLYELDELYEGK